MNASNVQQRLTNAIADYREGKGSKADVEKASRAVLADQQQLLNKQKAAYEAKVFKAAAQYGVSGKDLLKVLSGSYSDYQKAKNVPMTGIRYQVHTNQYGQTWTTTEKYAKNAAEQMGYALRHILGVGVRAVLDVDEGELGRVTASHIVYLGECGEELIGQTVAQTCVQIYGHRVYVLLQTVHRVGKRHGVQARARECRTCSTVH